MLMLALLVKLTSRGPIFYGRSAWAWMGTCSDAQVPHDAVDAEQHGAKFATAE
jgi:hypothetical protein